MNDPQQTVRVSVSEDEIDPAGLLEEVSRGDSGATVLFLGTVRDHSSAAEGVTHLDYEVYGDLVEAKITEVVDEACAKWPVLSIAVEHRSGRVDLRGISVAVAVSSAHRVDAFAAAKYTIDELKSRAPIWKKEFWPGGSRWSEGS